MDFWGGLTALLLQEQQRGLEIGQIMTIGSALPDYNKNNIVGAPIAPVNEKGRNEKTDANRAEIAKRFLLGSGLEEESKAEWLMWFDDDVVMPSDVISKLLSLDKIAVAGLYFNANPPYNPIAYKRSRDSIGYHTLYDYPFGGLFEVDSVGMGCTLTHRSVFEKILDSYRVYTRPNGSLIPVHNDDIGTMPQGWSMDSISSGRPESVVDGYLVVKLQDPEESDNRAFPFFAMEYGRTEDHHFWELAARVGVRPWVDTTITCGHIKPRQYKYSDYREGLNEYKGFSPR